MISRKSSFISFSKPLTKTHSLYSINKHQITTSVYPVPSSEESSYIDHQHLNNFYDSSAGIEYSNVKSPRIISISEDGQPYTDISATNYLSPLTIRCNSTSSSSSSSDLDPYHCGSPSSVRTSYVAAPKPAVPSYQYGIRIPTPLASPRYPSSIKSSSTSRSRRSSVITVMDHHPRNHRNHTMHDHVPRHMVGAIVSTDTLSSSYSNNTNSSSSGGDMPFPEGAAAIYDGSRPGGHRKKNSDTNIKEELFGIYPEKKNMGHGVSVADVMAKKLFKWGSKVSTPSTIPTPQPSNSKPKPKSTGNSSCRGRPLPPSPAANTPPQSNMSSSASFGNDAASRDRMMAAPQQQPPKLDDLLLRQRQLEEKIQQLKLERNALLELDVDQAVHAYDAKDMAKHALRQAGLPQMPPQPSKRVQMVRPESPELSIPHHSVSSSVHARSFQSTASSVTSSASGNSSKRQFPSSKHMHPLKTTPMAIPSATRMSQAPYPRRPLPEVPIDATPPPEYDQVIPSSLSIETKGYYGDDGTTVVEPDSPTCNDMKISFPMPPASSSPTHEIVLDRIADPRPSPKGEEIETEEILGWLDTMSPTAGARSSGGSKSSLELRSGPPNAPLPKPPGDIKHPAAIDPSTYSYYGRDVKAPIPEVDEPASGGRTSREDKRPRTLNRGAHIEGEQKSEKRPRSRSRLSTRPPAAQAAFRAREAAAAVDVM